MKHLSYDIINNRLKNGTFSLYVRTSDSIYEILEYLFSEICDMCNKHMLSENGCIFKIEYGEYGIVINSIHHFGASHVKCFRCSESEFESLKKCLVALNKTFQIYIKSSSFTKNFTVAFSHLNKIKVAG